MYQESFKDTLERVIQKGFYHSKTTFDSLKLDDDNKKIRKKKRKIYTDPGLKKRKKGRLYYFNNGEVRIVLNYEQII